MPFQPYYDKSLGKEITSESQREKLLYAYGLIDVRDYKDTEAIEKEAEENRKREIEKENAYMDEPIARALHQAEMGYDFHPELEARLLEEKEKQIAAQERAREIEKENQERRARDRK